MTEYIFPDLGKKLIRFLTDNGVTVVTPKGQNCCGAPVFLGAGDFDTGRKLADANVKAFKHLDYVITDCATCASALKEYSTFLADTDERHYDYLDLGNRIKDITEFLVDILQPPPSAYTVIPEINGKKVTWHDPCHLSRYLGVVKQPRRIMRSIPDIEYIEMPHADACCGMAGTFGLNAYDLSRKIADRKAEDINATGADIVVTACPGCRIQLTDLVLRHAMPQRVMHIMELFDV
jgi:glycolate oxidase iron-sulfur subunit